MFYPGQPPLLLRLAREDGQSQKELAKHMHVQPATLTVMIDRMAKHGLLERKTDARDQRGSRVYLTDKGRSAATGVREELERLGGALLGPALGEGAGAGSGSCCCGYTQSWKTSESS